MGAPEAVSCPWMRKQTTWIDKRGREREVPMEVICLGLSRTGTSSLRVALWELGYSAYHGFSLFENPPDGPLINEAFKAKFEGQGRRWSRKDWDALFFDCSAVIDNPVYAFVEDLIEAYPESKFIMTVRDVDSWYRSLQNTIIGPKAIPGFFSWLLEALDPGTRMTFSEFRTINRYVFGERPWTLTPEQAQRIWDDHIDKARTLAPKHQYLEYDVRQGWEPLCKFLGKAVPTDERGVIKPFPKVNDSQAFNDLLGPFLRNLLLKRLGKFILPYVFVIVGVVLLWRR